MSSQAIIGQLAESLRNLVLLATKDAGSAIFGTTEKDATEVTMWISNASKPDFGDEKSLRLLEADLLSKTFLVSNHLTVADVAVYGALYPTISKEQPEQYYSHPCLTRYFDHVQTRIQVRSAAQAISPPMSLVLFDIENAPKPTRATEPPKRKEKGAKVTLEAVGSRSTDDAIATTSDPSSKKEGKKEKKEVKEKKKETPGIEPVVKKSTGKNGSAVGANEPTVPVPSMIDLRVGRIVDVQKHPDADGLYVEQIDIGEDTGPRTVVSGLVNYIPIEEMRDKLLVTVCNLKPANMRGVKSFAMVLCATHKDGKQAGIEIIDPPKNSKPGDRVYFEGPYENDKPVDQLNPKKKIFETIQPGFITLETREAAWIEPVTKSVHRLRTGDGVCLAPSFVGASLS